MDKKIPEEKVERPAAVPEQVQEKAEVKETVEQPEAVAASDAQKLRTEIENTPLDDDANAQAQSHTQDIQQLEAEKKIKKLLELAIAKGAVYAVHVAKKMNDPYVLDKLHDELVKNNLHK